jgi:hypothetical protein
MCSRVSVQASDHDRAIMCFVNHVTTSTNNKLPGESWVLVASVTPDEAKLTTTQTPPETTLETRVASSEPLITTQTVFNNMTNEITTGEGEVSTEKLRETTPDPDSSEEEEDSSEYIGVTGSSSEEPTESDEDEATTTEPIEIDSPNNKTSTSTSSESTLTQSGNSIHH